jgi:hypothetical protein
MDENLPLGYSGQMIDEIDEREEPEEEEELEEELTNEDDNQSN